MSWASSDADMQERPTELTEEVAGSPATAEEATGHWYLRPRASGDVLMAEAGVNEITVVLFAATVDLAWSQLQDRLQDILEEALRASRDVPGPQVIPPLLHYTVRGLLQWKEELEAAAEDTIFWSLVFFNSVTAPAVVHIGGDQPALMAGDRPLVPRSLILRGRQGSTARALCLHPGRLRRISLAWSPLCPSTKSISASVQAEWVHELPDQGKTEPSGLVGLLDRVISRLGQGAKSRSDPAEREVADPTPSDSTESRPDAGEGFPALVGAEAEDSEAVRAPEPVYELVQPDVEEAPPALAPSLPEAAVSAPSPEPEPPQEELAPPRPVSSSPAAPPRQVELPPIPLPQRPRMPSWPAPRGQEGQPWRRGMPWLAAAAAVALFAFGWMLAGAPSTRSPGAPAARPVEGLLQAVGLGGWRYQCVVQSQPSGAAITVDGKRLDRTTPATLSLTPGEHWVTLRFHEWGTATYKVQGRRGEQVSLDAPLWGSIAVAQSGSRAPVSVSVDGVPQGYAPTMVDRLAPGPHEVQFSLPGTEPWGNTVKVEVGQTSEVTASPFAEPATGKVEVLATVMDDLGTEEAAGARVWVDGRPGGRTPLVLDLPRGPHSIRASYQSEESAVQVIDLPGGNKRFVRFQFGSSVDRPRLLLIPSQASPRSRMGTISAELQGVAVSKLREMWLHACTGEGRWRRYPMSLLPAPGGVVGVAALPSELLRERQKAPYYVSAMTNMGDEFFTEIQNSAEP